MRRHSLPLFEVSPSQLSNFDGCQRKWFFISVLKIRPPQKESAALGDKVHKALEDYLGDPEWKGFDFTTQVGYIAESAVPFLPPRLAPGIKIERKFSWQMPDTDIVYNGRIDLLVPAELRPEGRPLVHDHKTTGNLEYIKTPEVLRTDWQSIVYASDAMALTGHTEIDLRWLYLPTKKPYRPVPVDLTLGRDEVVAWFQGRVQPTALAMADLKAAAPDALDVTPSWDHCDSFGGCPFKSRCTDRPASADWKGLWNMPATENTMDLLAGLRAQAGLPPAQSTLTVPTPAAATIAMPPPATPGVSFSAEFLAQPDVPINPPEGKDAPEPPLVEAKPDTKPETPAKRGPGRPKKGAAPVTETTIVQKVEVPGKIDHVTIAQTIAQTINADKRFRLYVDCIPVGEHVIPAETLFAEANAFVCREMGVYDYRAVEYGAGPGALAKALDKFLNEHEGITSVFVSTATQEAHACMSVLLAHASSVTRGVR